MTKRRFCLSVVFGTILLLLVFSSLAQAFQPGDKVDVLWKGRWYPAVVIKTDGDRNYITYEGYDSSWDEWVGPDRIKLRGAGLSPGFVEGAPVIVLWKGRWYKARVLQAQGNSYYIHYDGYDSSWDEWVGPDRIRRR